MLYTKIKQFLNWVLVLCTFISGCVTFILYIVSEYSEIYRTSVAVTFILICLCLFVPRIYSEKQ